MNEQLLVALDSRELDHVAGGFLGPDQNVSDFPAWVLPYINIARVAQISQLGAVVFAGQR